MTTSSSAIYRRETALHGGLVMAKSGRLELGDNITDIIGLYSTTVTHLASKAIKFGEKSKRAITPKTRMRLPISDYSD